VSLLVFCIWVVCELRWWLWRCRLLLGVILNDFLCWLVSLVWLILVVCCLVSICCGCMCMCCLG